MAYGLKKKLHLSGAIAKENSFQAPYFDRIVKLWNYSCSIPPSLLSAKMFMNREQPRKPDLQTMPQP